MNCPNCGATLRPGARFCGQCGVEQASSPRAGETGTAPIAADAPGRPIGMPSTGAAPRILPAPRHHAQRWLVAVGALAAVVALIAGYFGFVVSEENVSPELEHAR